MTTYKAQCYSTAQIKQSDSNPRPAGFEHGQIVAVKHFFTCSDGTSIYEVSPCATKEWRTSRYLHENFLERFVI